MIDVKNKVVTVKYNFYIFLLGAADKIPNEKSERSSADDELMA
jgi:hypothetical protein